MSESLARSRLLSLLPGLIEKLNQFLALVPTLIEEFEKWDAGKSDFPWPVEIEQNVRLAAGYLEGMELKPEAIFLIEDLERIWKTGIDVWVERLGGPVYLEQVEGLRVVRINTIRYALARLVERLQTIRQIVEGEQETSHGKGATPINGPDASLTGGQKPGKGTVDSDAGIETLEESERNAIMKEMKPADKKAYFSFQYAETQAEQKLEDQEAYKLLSEKGIQAGKGDLGEMTDYDLPSFDTWSRQLRNARNALKEQKYKRRGQPMRTRSIVGGNQIENQRNED